MEKNINNNFQTHSRWSYSAFAAHRRPMSWGGVNRIRSTVGVRNAAQPQQCTRRTSKCDRTRHSSWPFGWLLGVRLNNQVEDSSYAIAPDKIVGLTAYLQWICNEQRKTVPSIKQAANNTRAFWRRRSSEKPYKYTMEFGDLTLS